MKLLAVQPGSWLVLLALLYKRIGSSSGCLAEGGDYDFKLRFGKSFITARPGCAQIPCAYSAPMRTHSGRLVWFRGSPEFPLSPHEMKKKEGLMRPMPSILDECSIALLDLNPRERTEEYGIMLEWGTNETHIYDERVTVSYSPAFLNISLSSETLLAGKQTLITCTLPDLCPDSDPKVTWTGLKSKHRLPWRFPRKMKASLQHIERLMYTPVPEDHQTQVTCEVTYGNNQSANASTTLTVHSHPQILNSSLCSLKLDQLTCVCISQGSPLPDIHWSLQNSIDFNTITTPEDPITVRSSFTMTMEDASNISPTVCISRNPLGQKNTTLPLNLDGVKKGAQEDGEYRNHLEN